MTLPVYSTGTVSVNNLGTTVTGAGCMWSGINAREGDFFVRADGAAVITEVTDATTLQITPWPGATVTGGTYAIQQNYVGRVVGVAAAEDVGVMLEKLHTDGLPFLVGADETVPDPSYGDEGQLAFQPSTGDWWVKQGGVWVPSVGLSALGYGGSSATSLTIGMSLPTKVFTTQTGLAYNGARVRAASAANLNNWMEGVSTYAGSTLTMTCDFIGGAGTHADWLFSVAGQKGATGAAGPPGAAGGSFPDANSDNKTYGRRNAAWTEIVSGGSVLVSETPPAGAVDNSLWFESDTGLLYIRYNDGTSTQFVAIPGGGGGATPSDSLPLMDGVVAAGGLAATYSRSDHVHPTDTSLAPLNSPTFIGAPKAPTPAQGVSDASIATAAFVASAVAAGGGGGSFIQSGAGAVTRTMQDKARDFVTVLDYGADPTGAIDSTAAIRAAVSASRYVYLNAGTYLISGTITLPANTTLLGAGPYASILVRGGVVQSYLVLGNQCAVEKIGMHPVGAAVNVPPSTVPTSGIGIDINNASSCVIRDIWTEYLYTGIRTTQVYACFMNSLNIHSTYARALSCEDTSLDVHVNGFVFHGNNTTIDSLVYIFGASEAVELTSGDVLYGAYGMATAATSYTARVHPAFCKFTGVYFDSSANGVAVDKADGFTFTGCWFSNSTNNGVTIAQADDTRFIGCDIVHNVVHGAALASANAKRTKFIGCNIAGNNVGNSGADGVAVVAGVSNFVITGCTITNNYGTIATGNQRYGINVFAGGSDYYVISNNELSGNITADLFDGGTGSHKTVLVNPTNPTVSIANNGTYDFNGDGFVELIDNGALVAGGFFTSFGSAAIVTDPLAKLSNASGTAGKLNCFFTGTSFRLENKLGSTVNLYLNIRRIRPAN